MEGIDPTYQPDSQNRRSALHAAAQRGLLEICYMLVQVSTCLIKKGVVSDRNTSWCTCSHMTHTHTLLIILPLMLKIVSGCILQAGAKVDAQDKDLRTPLLEAIINNHIEVAHYLVQNGACVYHVVSVCYWLSNKSW